MDFAVGMGLTLLRVGVQSVKMTRFGLLLSCETAAWSVRGPVA